MLRKKEKLIRVILIFVTGFTILILLVSVTIDPILERMIDHRLKSLIRGDPDRHYDISYDSLRIDIRKGDVIVTNLKVRPRNRINDSLDLSFQPNKHTIDLQLGRFEMINFKWVKFLLTWKLEVGEFLFSDLEVKYYLNENVILTERASLGADILAPKFIAAETPLIELENGSLEMFMIREDTSLALSFDSLSVRFMDFYSDSTLIKEPIGYKLGKLDLSLRNLRDNQIEQYTLSCYELAFNSTENIFFLDSIRLIPSPSKTDTKNWFDLSVDSLEIKGIQYDSLLKSGTVLIRQLVVHEPSFTYVRPVERLQIDTVRSLPAVTFRKIPVSLAIDTIKVINGSFDYLKHGFREPLVSLNVTDLNVNGINFTSDPVRLNRKNIFYISGTTRFLDEAPLKLNFSFPLMDPHDSFQIKGWMDTLNAVSLNPIIKNSKSMMVERGSINNLQFEINGNDTLSTGYVRMDYQDLKLAALNVNINDFTDTKRRGFMSGILNYVARSGNDPDKSSFSEGIIYLERDPYYTFLDYSLESLMTGLLTSIVPESKLFIRPAKQKK